MSLKETKNYWENEAVKRINDSNEDLFDDYWTKRYIDNLKYLKPGNRILDIGCGDAKYFIKLKNKYNEFYGIELSEIHFETAKKLFPSGNYAVADANELPFENCFFDTIISFGAFEHNEDITDIFKECYRVLNKEGILLFSVPNYYSTYFPYLYIYNRLKGYDMNASIGHNYPMNHLKLNLEKVGFKNIKTVDTIYASPLPISRVISTLFNNLTNLNIFKRKNKDAEGETIKNKSINKYNADKIFYPLEYIGLGFMRVIFCSK